MVNDQRITVEVVVECDIDTAWAAFTRPDAIVEWNFASPDWCCPKAENDLRKGGNFNYRMEAKDGSMGFDFAGTFSEVIPSKRLVYALGDDREVSVDFQAEDGKTRVVETFVAENTFSVEQQRSGWQAILDNYKRVAEGQAR